MADPVAVQKRSPVRPWLIVALVTVLALALRVAWLGSKGLWIDEADSVYFARHSLPDVLFHLCDPHPPGYYVFLKPFLGLGQSEFLVRLPSAIAGAAAIPLLYILCRELGVAAESAWLDRRTAVVAALLLAVAPLHVWYSQEARMYALVTTLGLGAAVFAARFARRGRVGDALGYVLLASLSLLTDQSAALPLLLASVLWAWVWLRRSRPREGYGWRMLVAWVGLQGGAGTVFWLWRSQALYAPLGDGGLYQLPMVMLLLQRLGLPVDLAAVRLGSIVGIAICAALGLLLWARRRWVRRFAPALAPAVLLLYLLATVGSAVPRLFTVKRLLLGLLPHGLLLTVWAIRRLRLKPWMVSVLIVLSLMLSGVNVLLIPKGDWADVAATVQREMDPGDVLLVDELVVPAFDYYDKGSHRRFVLRTTELARLGSVVEAARRDVGPDGVVWFVAMADPYRDLLGHLPPSLSQEMIWSRDWHGVTVRAYAWPPSGSGHSVPSVDLPAWLLAWPSPLDEACRE
jgi:4-amino-4-deoxy-L-arabinose transferase-like glycosyltransferase